MDLSESGRVGMSDEERKKLAESLDQQLEDYIEKLEKRPRAEGQLSIDNLEQEMQQHPAFRTEPFKEGEELPPLFQAMQQLKYDPTENSPDELAINYKADGNNNFKLKKYRWAIDSYTEGIKIETVSAEVKCQLYTNRAAANYRLGNFRKSLLDCYVALKYKENHMKALTRGAQCYQQLQRFNEALDWCTKGLMINPKESLLLEIKVAVEKQKKIMERDGRKRAVQQKKVTQKEEELLKEIKARGVKIAKPIKFDGSTEKNLLALSSLEPFHPAAVGAKVHLDEHGSLVWPVMFIYPECTQMDFIQKFNENESFIEHLDVMFGTDDERPSWDRDRKYIPENLKVYFEEELSNALWEIESTVTLVDVLQHQSYIVSGGTPNFFITVKGSEFDKDFVKKYNSFRKIHK